MASEKTGGPAIHWRELPDGPPSDYPVEYRGPVQGRIRRKLGDPFGLTQFGVNVTRLKPGAWSSQRHWHAKEDELIFVLEGHPTLITDGGAQRLAPGMFAGFPAGKADGHHLINQTEQDVLIVEIGTRTDSDRATYTDLDMIYQDAPQGGGYRRKNGEPY